MSESKASLLAKVAYIFHHLNNSKITEASTAQQAQAFSLIFKSVYGNERKFLFDTIYSPIPHSVFINELNLSVAYPYGLLVNNITPACISDKIDSNSMYISDFHHVVEDLKKSIQKELNSNGYARDNLKHGGGILDSFVKLTVQHDNYVSAKFVEFVRDCLNSIANSTPDLNLPQSLANMISLSNIENAHLTISKDSTDNLCIKKFVVTNNIHHEEFIFFCDFENLRLIYNDSDSKVCNIISPAYLDDFLGIQPNGYIMSHDNTKLAGRVNLKGKSRYGEFEQITLLIYSHGYYLKTADFINHGLKIKPIAFDYLINCKNKKYALDTLVDIFKLQNNLDKLSLIHDFLHCIDLKGDAMVCNFSNKIVERKIDIIDEIKSFIMPTIGIEKNIQAHMLARIYESQVYIVLLSEKMLCVFDDAHLDHCLDSIDDIAGNDNNLLDTLSL